MTYVDTHGYRSRTDMEERVTSLEAVVMEYSAHTNERIDRIYYFIAGQTVLNSAVLVFILAKLMGA